MRDMECSIARGCLFSRNRRPVKGRATNLRTTRAELATLDRPPIPRTLEGAQWSARQAFQFRHILKQDGGNA